MTENTLPLPGVLSTVNFPPAISVSSFTMAALPESERDLLVAKYTQGESIEQLQESYSASPSATKMRLMSAKEKLNHWYAAASVVGLQAVLSQLKQL